VAHGVDRKGESREGRGDEQAKRFHGVSWRCGPPEWRPLETETAGFAKRVGLEEKNI
jgi:hypothetical protein